MEITPQIAETMIASRFHEYPQMKAVAESASFKETLSGILDFGKVDSSLYGAVETEILLVLSLYAPLHELAQNIAESTGITQETAENIATLIETLILQPVYDELSSYDTLWQNELEKSEKPALDPEPVQTKAEEVSSSVTPVTEEQPDQRPLPRTTVAPAAPSPLTGRSGAPLTREDVLNAFSTKADALEVAPEPTPTAPVHGYEAFQKEAP